MDITQWLNEFSDDDDPESSADDKFNDPDFVMPDLQNRNIDYSCSENEQLSDENGYNVEPISEEDISGQSNGAQHFFILDNTQLNWGPVTGNLNDFSYNPDNDLVGINPDIIDCMSGCSPHEFFNLFVDNTVIYFLVIETNRYAQSKLNNMTSRLSRISK